MRGDKSPGVKILWVWMFGTAAVMVANVTRTRMRDMDEYVKTQDRDQLQGPNADASVMADELSDPNIGGTPEENLETLS